MMIVIEGLLWARHCTFSTDNSCHDPSSSGMKPRLREVKSFVQGHNE